MAWIERGLQAGRDQRIVDQMNEQARQRQRAAFEAEVVTPQTVSEVLKVFVPHIKELMLQLRQAGFKIFEIGPGFLVDSEIDGTHGETYRQAYSLHKKGHRQFGMWELNVPTNEIFGIEYCIKFFNNQSHNDTLGTVTIYPTVSQATHFAGVEVRGSFELRTGLDTPVPDFVEQVPVDQDPHVVAMNLQTRLTEWVRLYARVIDVDQQQPASV